MSLQPEVFQRTYMVGFLLMPSIPTGHPDVKTISTSSQAMDPCHDPAAPSCHFIHPSRQATKCKSWWIQKAMIILGKKVNYYYYICNNLKMKSIKKEGIFSKAQSACSVRAFYISGSSGTGY
jgi:hypothetical protein